MTFSHQFPTLFPTLAIVNKDKTELVKDALESILGLLHFFSDFAMENNDNFIERQSNIGNKFHKINVMRRLSLREANNIEDPAWIPFYDPESRNGYNDNEYYPKDAPAVYNNYITSRNDIGRGFDAGIFIERFPENACAPYCLSCNHEIRIEIGQKLMLGECYLDDVLAPIPDIISNPSDSE